ncbi:MAG: sensor histidine kinase [Thermomicrobiales bacterium]
MSTPFTLGEPNELRERACVLTERWLRPRPWTAAAFLAFNLGLGIVSFVVWVVLVAVGAGLAVTLIGLPILIITMYMWVGAARMERRRIESFGGGYIPEPYRVTTDAGFYRRLKVQITDSAVWRDLFYLIALFPIGVIEFAIVGLAAIWPLSMITIPLYYWMGDSPAIGGWRIDTLPEAIMIALLGVVVALPALLLISGAARAHFAFAHWMLGPSQEQLEERVEVLTRTRSGVMEAMLVERRRIERDLHDGAQQRLVSLAMGLGMAKEKMESDPDAARQLLDASHDEAKRVLVELRELVRGIHPAVLTDRGIDAAISAVAGRSPVPVTVDVDLNGRLPEAVESTAYFVVVEALANVAKHSNASAARVHVRREHDWLIIDVEDNGAGGASMHDGTGLIGLAERLAALDGQFAVQSPTGQGTRVRAEIPCGS